RRRGYFQSCDDGREPAPPCNAARFSNPPRKQTTPGTGRDGDGTVWKNLAAAFRPMRLRVELRLFGRRERKRPMASAALKKTNRRTGRRKSNGKRQKAKVSGN